MYASGQLTPSQHYPREINPVPTEYETGWALQPVRTRMEKCFAFCELQTVQPVVPRFLKRVLKGIHTTIMTVCKVTEGVLNENLKCHVSNFTLRLN